MFTQSWPSRFRTVSALVIIVATSSGMGWWARGYWRSRRPPTRTVIREAGTHYTFINPLLGCELYGARPAAEFSSLNATLRSALERARTSGAVQNASVYLRDLTTGRWTGINENDPYDPASMLKVLTMMAYFRAAEPTPSVLTEKLRYDDPLDRNAREYYRATTSLVAGQSYTVSELVARMIGQSGNNASNILHTHLGEHALADVYTALGLPLPSGSSTDFMSAHAYSIVFRALYNATFLSREMSEHALDFLSQTEFKDGLVAGVPSGTLVAHKFGERTLLSSDGSVVSRELHDCGIVYAKTGPYFLCVMTRGTAFPELANMIQTISRTVFNDRNP